MSHLRVGKDINFLAVRARGKEDSTRSAMSSW